MKGLDSYQQKILAELGIRILKLKDSALSKKTAIPSKFEVPSYQANPKTTMLASENTQMSDAPSSIQHVAEKINHCQACLLGASRINAVPGAGNEQADWVFVGDAPGQNEDQQGLPFVGRAGQLLDAMIFALRMDRAQVFIGNVIKCRSPSDRDPFPEELAQCEPYLHQQLALLNPKVIVALGRISAQVLMKTDAPLDSLRGQVFNYGENKIPIIPTYHPSDLLKKPLQKQAVWEDLLLAQSVVNAVS